MNKTILLAVLVTISAINAFAGGRGDNSSGRTEHVSSYTRANGTVVQSYYRHPAGSGLGETSSTRATGAGNNYSSYSEGIASPAESAEGTTGSVTLLYYTGSELAAIATYKANIKSGKWHPFKNGE
jgi:hypothetical protein